jgi:hypothetical protein
MATTRTPLEPPTRIEISESAVQLFLEMETLRQSCRCEPVDQEHYWLHEPCASCVARRKVHIDLHKELGLRPWDMILGLWSPGRPYWKALQAAARELHNDQAEGAGQLSSNRGVLHTRDPRDAEDGDGPIPGGAA